MRLGYFTMPLHPAQRAGTYARRGSRWCTPPFDHLVRGRFIFDAGLAKRSMKLMATEVMPRVNEVISKGETACSAQRS
jgi:hypothetical protein